MFCSPAAPDGHCPEWMTVLGDATAWLRELSCNALVTAAGPDGP